MLDMKLLRQIQNKTKTNVIKLSGKCTHRGAAMVRGKSVHQHSNSKATVPAPRYIYGAPACRRPAKPLCFRHSNTGRRQAHQD